MNLRWGRRCRGSRIRSCCAAAATMSMTWSCRGWCSAMYCGHRTRMRALFRSTRLPPSPRPACLRCWPERIGKPRAGAICRAPQETSCATARPLIARTTRHWSRTGCDGSGLRRLCVAESARQAADAAELISVEYEPLPAIVSTTDAMAPGAPHAWDDCPNNICFVYLQGDKATDAAFAGAAHVVRHKFTINRVTAATMEPRGCIGDYKAAADHYTIYTTLQRTHSYRSELAQFATTRSAKAVRASQPKAVVVDPCEKKAEISPWRMNFIHDCSPWLSPATAPL